MDLSPNSLRPVGCGIDGSNLTPHRHLKKLIVPFTTLELMADTRNAKRTVLRMQRKDVIECFRHILMIILNDFALIFLTFGQRSKLLRAVEP